jgi:hypothetical protein
MAAALTQMSNSGGRTTMAAMEHQEGVMRSTFGIRSVCGAALAALMLGSLAQPSAALEISKHASDSAEINAIQLKGKVEDGDTFDLQVYISNLPKKPSVVVYMNSPGGNLREGMRLGRFFFDNKIETAVETKTGCASACALAFLGGRDGATGKPRRTKASNSGVGFHSFSRDFDKDKNFTADDMKTIVQQTQTQVYLVADYLKSIGADMDILRLMLRAQANQMNYISNDEAIALNIRVWDEKRNQLVDPEQVLERLDRSRTVTNTPEPTTASPSSMAPRPVTANREGKARS